MKKNGFTLVELLAVIAILAILAIIALPNVMKMMNDSKKNSFVVEATEILKTAKQQWLIDSMTSADEIVYYNGITCTYGKCKGSLSLDGRSITYAIKINSIGEAVAFAVKDDSYCMLYSSSPINVTDIKASDVELTSDSSSQCYEQNVAVNSTGIIGFR